MYYSMNVKNQKLMDAILGLVHITPFYFEILTMCNFEEHKEPGFLAGVRLRKNGTFVFGYNPEFVNTLNENQIKFLIVHEIQHILSNHQHRMITGGLDFNTANICADMIINSNILLGYPAFEMPSAEINGKKETIGVVLPKEYEEEKVLEPLYDWYLEKNPPVQMEVMSISFGEGNGEEGNGKGDSNKEVKGIKIGNGTYIDQEETKKEQGFQNEVGQELIDSIIDDLLNSMKSRGKMSANDEENLGRLRKSKKNYLSLIKREVANCMGGVKTPTWKRFSRKYELAVGFHKVKNEINVLLDTSGSMTGLFEKALSYIFYNDITINLIQIDTEIKKVVEVNSMKQLQKMTIGGHGGTELMGAIDYISKNKKLNSLPLLVLTDGYCDTLNFSNIKGKVLVISVGTKVPMTGNKKVREVIVSEE